MVLEANLHLMEHSSDNKRIAKNTLFLYLRMFFVMLVSLYTSRLVLQGLGIVDYGIYNVVGGTIAMFEFLNGAMINATQRYITFELGRGDISRMRQVFTASFNIHLIALAFVILCAETLGLWLVLNKLTYPENRQATVLIVYQLSILTSAIIFMGYPFFAEIIAHEKMGVFAYLSILEVLIKLFTAYWIIYYNFDRLILYAILILLSQILIRAIYVIYCWNHFPETKFLLCWNSKMIREMGIFASWHIVGNLSAQLYIHGLNVLLNMFFGPSVNAARAVAGQIQNAITQFSRNFQMAVNPQITKSYAQNDKSYLNNLLYSSTKYTYFLLIILVLPIMLQTDSLLNLWLQTVPEYSATFIRILLVITIVESFGGPLMTAVSATGNVRNFQMVPGLFLLLIVPLSYIILKLGAPPSSVFLVYLFMMFVTFIYRFILSHNLIGFSYLDYFKEVILKCFNVTVVPLLISYILTRFSSNTIFELCSIFIISIISILLSIYFIGLSKIEKNYIICKIKKRKI